MGNSQKEKNSQNPGIWGTFENLQYGEVLKKFLKNP